MNGAGPSNGRPPIVYTVLDSDDEDSEIEEGQLVLSKSAKDARAPPPTIKKSAAPATATQAKQAVRSKVSKGASAPQRPPPLANRPTKAPLRWTDGEKVEAMKIIKEISAFGLDPARLIREGISEELVKLCCQELRIPMIGTEVPAHIPVRKNVTHTPSGSSGNQQEIASTTRISSLSKVPSHVHLPPKPKASASLSIDSEQPAKVETLANPEGRTATASVQLSSSPVMIAGSTGSSKKNKKKQKKGKNVAIAQPQLRSSSVQLPPPTKKARSSASGSGSSQHLPAGDSPKDPLPSEQIVAPVVTPPMARTADSSVEAMRRAALASMKRKASGGNVPAVSETALVAASPNGVTPVTSAPADAVIGATTLEIPTGPKAGRAFYHDVDAPVHQDYDDDMYGSDEEEKGKSASGSLQLPADRDGPADPRQRKRSKLSSEADSLWDADAPSGDVDLEAPLPMLLVATSSKETPRPRSANRVNPSSLQEKKAASIRSRKRMVAADFLDVDEPYRFKQAAPFLPSSSWQHLVVDCSDDEDDHARSEQAAVRETNSFFASFWEKRRGEVPAREVRMPLVAPANTLDGKQSMTATNMSRSPSGGTTLELTSDTLSQKEKEIRDMMAKIQALEKRKGNPAVDAKTLVTAAKVAVNEAVEAQQKVPDSSGTDAKTPPLGRSNGLKSRITEDDKEVAEVQPSASLPAYESIFSRYPHLRQGLD